VAKDTGSLAVRLKAGGRHFEYSQYSIFIPISIPVNFVTFRVGQKVKVSYCTLFISSLIIGVYISPKTPGRIEPKFVLVVDVPDVITPFKFDDNRFRGFGLAGGSNFAFSTDFKDCPYNTHINV